MAPTEATAQPAVSARRQAMEEARRSKRPSRANQRAGTAPQPDYVLSDAGFTELLRQTLATARASTDLATRITTLATLSGRLPEQDAWRVLTREEQLAVRVLTRADRVPVPERIGTEPAPVVFTSALGLSPHGKLVVTVPGERVLPSEVAATGVADRVAWSPEDLACYQQSLPVVRREHQREVAECRALLDSLGEEGRAGAVDALRQAIFLVPPVLFYHRNNVYSNLRAEPGNLTGKTLLPSNPDCFFHHLDKLPFDLWTDDEAVFVACLWLLYLSGGPNRLESFNGYQVTLRNVSDNLRGQCAVYDEPVPPLPESAERLSAEALRALAERLATVRADLVARRRLYYEINATTRRKAERLFSADSASDLAERRVSERLAELFPAAEGGFSALLAALRDDPELLATPTAGLPSGFEAIIHRSVVTAGDLLSADMALSRGIRSLPRLVDALAEQNWKEIVSWELPEFYCCVVPSPDAVRLYDGDYARLADSAWAVAARMQYNTWHVMPGNLPNNPVVQARDFLAPHVLPDLATHSDLHHRGHVANHIRYSARSPETVVVGGAPFKSLTDLRVLRCEGPPFTERELYAVTRIARFLAQVSELVAELAATGVARNEVRSFDHKWYVRTIIEQRLVHDA